jgi:hypothetical protein
MNYSQRKHLERLMAQEPSWGFDPLGIWPSRSAGMFAGLKVIESPDVPRYTLPAEVMPGVPWPPGFRDEINAWSRSFLGMTNVVPKGTAYVLAGGHTVMRREDVLKISSIC